MDETRSAIGGSRGSFAQADRYSGPRTLAICAGFGRTATDTLRLVKQIKASEEYSIGQGKIGGKDGIFKSQLPREY